MPWMMRRRVMAMPTGASCSQRTQTTICTATIGTQCALRFLSSAGSQTEALFPDADANGFFRGFPTLQDGAGSLVCSLGKQQGDHISSYSSGNTGCWCSNAPCRPITASFLGEWLENAANEHRRFQIGGKIYAGEFSQKSNDCKTNLTADDELSVGVRHHTCSVCKKSFPRKGMLLIHIRVHTGERPYICRFCQKSFAQKANLVNHEKLHTGQKPYSCNSCHKAFARKGDLVNHERLHTGERPYLCSYCHKSFNKRESLVNHERLHTGERPYTCGVCHKSFTQRANLYTHEKLHR